jgi:ankyrin repeat protein
MECTQQDLLFQAIDNNDFELFKNILPNVDINCREPTKNSTPLIRAAFKNRIDMVKLLIENNASLDCHSAYNNTALMLASYNNYIDISLLLIKAGANIHFSAMCLRGRRSHIRTNTVLTNALTLSADNKSIDVAKILINYGIVTKENIDLAKRALGQFIDSRNTDVSDLLYNAIIKIEPAYKCPVRNKRQNINKSIPKRIIFQQDEKLEEN